MKVTRTTLPTSLDQAFGQSQNPYSESVAKGLGTTLGSGASSSYYDNFVEMGMPVLADYAVNGLWQPIDHKLSYWNRVLETTYQDIFYIENTLLYDRSSAI